MQNFKLVLEYDGSKFSGWQRQANVRTVQEEIEKAFEQVLGFHVNVIGAGRTDAGVHARGQVANVRIDDHPLAPGEIVAFLGGIFPRDIVCHSVENVPETFHARFDAIQRTYSYSITQHKIAIGRAYSWHIHRGLNHDAMQHAAQIILGEQDFTAFSKENPEVTNRVCTVSKSHWSVTNTSLSYTITAERFVYSMVRALVGAMVNVGRGRITVEDFLHILESRDRKLNKNPLAPPHGLCLERVEYRHNAVALNTP